MKSARAREREREREREKVLYIMSIIDRKVYISSENFSFSFLFLPSNLVPTNSINFNLKSIQYSQRVRLLLRLDRTHNTIKYNYNTMNK